MRTPNKLTIVVLISLAVISPSLLAGEPDQVNQPTELILEIDSQTLNLHAQQVNNIHIYHDIAKKKKSDSLTTRIVRARKAFKRITSIRYKKNQKLRAHISKSGYALQYTHSL